MNILLYILTQKEEPKEKSELPEDFIPEAAPQKRRPPHLPQELGAGVTSLGRHTSVTLTSGEEGSLMQ